MNYTTTPQSREDELDAIRRGTALGMTPTRYPTQPAAAPQGAVAQPATGYGGTGYSRLELIEAIRKYGVGGAQAPATPATPTSRYDTGSTPGLLSGAQREAAFIDQDAISRQAEETAARQRQAQIDAINALYAPKYQMAEEEAGREKSRARALALRTGQMGSGENPYQVAGAEELSKAKRAELDASKQAQIQLAFGTYDAMRQKEQDRILKEKTATAEAKVKYYKDIYDTAIQTAKQFGAGGITLDELKSKDAQAYQDLKDIGGMSDFEIAAQMAEGNPALNAKIEYQDGVAYLAYVNPTTGKMEIQTQNVGPLQSGEEFKSIDGIGYAVKKDASGKLTARALTTKQYAPKSETTSSTEIKSFINKQMATPAFKNMNPEQKEDFIRANGGTPSDFDF